MPTVPLDNVDTPTFCRSCRYPLGGLQNNRCPECGEEFDPNDPATFMSTPTIRTAKQLLRMVLLIALLHSALCTLLVLVVSFAPEDAGTPSPVVSVAKWLSRILLAPALLPNLFEPDGIPGFFCFAWPLTSLALGLMIVAIVECRRRRQLRRLATALETPPPDVRLIRRMSWRRRSVLFLLVLVAVLSFWRVFLFVPPRPMFCNSYGPNHGFLSEWRPSTGLRDPSGTVVYCDRELNLLVIIVTSKPAGSWLVPPPTTVASECATLLEGTPYAFDVTRQEDALIIVMPDLSTSTFALPLEGARSIFLSINSSLADDWEKSNVLDYLPRAFNGHQSQQLRAFISNHTVAP